MKLKTIALVAALTGVSILAQAQSGTISLSDVGSAAVSPGPAVNGNTNYTIGELASFSGLTGYFIGLGTQFYNPVTFDPSVSGSFSFGNAVFGTFTSTSIVETTSTIGQESFHILGLYNSGTFDDHSLVADPASVDLTFIQNPPGTGGISDTAVFSIPPTADPVPEPTTMAFAALGGASLLLFRRRK